MADTLIIRIDLETLTANLSTGEGRPVFAAEVSAFLAEAGFIHLGGDRYGCEEISLRALAASEWIADPPPPRKPGRCWCGYDVRATPVRCPECGRKL